MLDRLKFAKLPRFQLGPMLSEIAKHLFTAADGETYAVGRFLGIVLLFFGLVAPSVGAIYICFIDPPTWEDLERFLGVVGPYLGLLSASVVGLITLTNQTEPKPPTASVTTRTGATTTTVATDPAPTAPAADPAPRIEA